MIRRMEARISSIDGSCVRELAALMGTGSLIGEPGNQARPCSISWRLGQSSEADRRSTGFRVLTAVRGTNAPEQVLDLIEMLVGAVLRDVEPQRLRVEAPDRLHDGIGRDHA